MLHSLNFSPAITEPTRYPTGNLSRNRPSTLDHIFINQIVPWKAVIFMDDISDHCGCAMRIGIFMTRNNLITKSFSFRPFSNDNLLKLENKFLDTDWSLLLASTDINEQLLSVFQSYLDDSYCNYFPLKTKITTEKRDRNPWVTNETIQLSRLKSNYFKMKKMESFRKKRIIV